MILFRYLNSSAAIVLGYKVYGSDAPTIIRWLHRKLCHIDRLIWKLRYRLQAKHRYHLVDTGLEPGYHDIDERLLHASMNLLCAYVESRYGNHADLEKHIQDMCSNPDPNAPDGLVESCVDMESEALAIYRWWKEQRPVNHAHLDVWCSKLFSGKFERWVDEDGQQCFGVRTPRDESMGTTEEYHAYEDKLNQDDEDMLHRLVDIRQGLWT